MINLETAPGKFKFSTLTAKMAEILQGKQKNTRNSGGEASPVICCVQLWVQQQKEVEMLDTKGDGKGAENTKI